MCSFACSVNACRQCAHCDLGSEFSRDLNLLRFVGCFVIWGCGLVAIRFARVAAIQLRFTSRFKSRRFGDASVDWLKLRFGVSTLSELFAEEADEDFSPIGGNTDGGDDFVWSQSELASNLAICDLNIAMLRLIPPLRLISVRLISVAKISGNSCLVGKAQWTWAGSGMHLLESAINLSKCDFAGGRLRFCMPRLISRLISNSSPAISPQVTHL